MSGASVLFILRNDLRIVDNPALAAACKAGAIIPVYNHQYAQQGMPALGYAQRGWLKESLHALSTRMNGSLRCYQGDPYTVISSLVSLTNATDIFVNKSTIPAQRNYDRILQKKLSQIGVRLHIVAGTLLLPHDQVMKHDGTPYKMYTPFYRLFISKAGQIREIVHQKYGAESFQAGPVKGSCLIDDLFSSSESQENNALKSDAGEERAKEKLDRFIADRLTQYDRLRDIPAEDGCSGLSPHLRFGEISVHTIWHSLSVQAYSSGKEVFLKEIIWRQFALYLLEYFPELPEQNIREKFDRFPWNRDEKILHAWKMGQTGIPLVDAGMRELYRTGTMHNRVRMIVASFLVKNCLQHWHSGRDWFWERLFDADLASNSMNWQWVAGTGIDASPYFRIFNPVTQGEKFDPNGDYIRRFVPELAHLPNKYIHRPWDAPERVVVHAGFLLERDYFKPIVDLKESRKRALEIYKQLG